MKIARKMLVSYLLIVALFASIGAVITLNTMTMNQLQTDASKQVEIGTYVNTYQKGIDLKKLAFIEGTAGNHEQSSIDDQTASALITPCEDYLLATLPAGSEQYTTFSQCYEISRNVITPTATEIAEIYSSGSTDRYNEIATTLGPRLATAYAEIGTNLDNLNLAVIESVVDSTNQSQNYATFSILLAAAGISVIAVVSIILALVMSKRITSPLKKLTTVAGKASMGELNHETKFNTKDEISDLGEAFQRMINAFKMTSAMAEGNSQEI
jgi:methyl-accepting chemotaxis protein